MIRKSTSWALKPLQVPPPPEPPESPELKLSRLEVEIVPGAGDGLTDADWLTIVCRLKLSARESEIIHYIVTEQKDRAIAHELDISYNTLRTQLSRVYCKLGVQTRTGVVVRTYETFIEVRQMEAKNAEQQSHASCAAAHSRKHTHCKRR